MYLVLGRHKDQTSKYILYIFILEISEDANGHTDI